jgi:hypothetical protein
MFFGEPPDAAQIEAWNRMYLEHRRDRDDRTRCAKPDCLGRFPCAARLEAAELLIVAGIGVPTDAELCPPVPAPRLRPRTPHTIGHSGPPVELPVPPER